MPVVWHERKGKEFNRIFLKPLAKDANERVIVFRLMKNFLPRISTIDRVIANPSFAYSLLSRHHSSPVMDSLSATEAAILAGRVTFASLAGIMSLGEFI